MEQRKKKYGLWSGMALVVGVVIGSGVFVKAGDVLKASGGNFILSLTAWLVGGLIMVISGFCFAKFATKVAKYNGLVDYVEVSGGKRAGYYVAYFASTLYFPVVGSIISLVSTSYICSVFNYELTMTSWQLYLIAFSFLIFFTALNYFAPRISDRFRISIAVIKIVPILILIVVGLFAPLIYGPGHSMIDPFIEKPAEGMVANFGEAVKLTSFAYDGWICATAINAEMKEPKKNLPRALTFGTIIVVIFYLLYFISLSAVLTNAKVMEYGALAPVYAFVNIMGNAGAKVFTIFIFLSCFNNINAMEFCTASSLMAMGVRDEGFFPSRMAKKVNNHDSLLPHFISLCWMAFYLVIWYLAFKNIWIFGYLTSMDSIVCSILYAFYIIVYIYIIRNFKELNVFSRYVLPILAILGALFFIFCGTGLYQLIFSRDINSIKSFGVFLALAAIIFAPGIFIYEKREKELKRGSIINS